MVAWDYSRGQNQPLVAWTTRIHARCSIAGIRGRRQPAISPHLWEKRSYGQRHLARHFGRTKGHMLGLGATWIKHTVRKEMDGLELQHQYHCQMRTLDSQRC
jgi:hypothetical protein